MSDRLKYERFLWFHTQTKALKFPNASHLADYFEISSRTAQRDIEFFRDRLNAPLKYNHQLRGYSYTDDSYELPAHWVSESNILALTLAVRLASIIPDQALKDQLCRLIEKIPIQTNNTSTPCLEQLSSKISVKNIEYAQVDTDIFRHVIEALFTEFSLKITYYSPHTETTTTRIINALHLMHYMGSWHLIAWCGNRMELRNFSLSRIQKIEHVIEDIPLPDNLPNIKEYTRRHFGIMKGGTTTEVSLLFSPKIAPFIQEQIWHPQQQAELKSDGSLTLNFPVADFRELTKTILSHGADIKIMEPPELKRLVQEEIKKMAKIYV